MRPLKKFSSVIPALVIVASLVPLSQAVAEDTKGKWQFGFGLSYMSTVDYIRSNADLALAQTVVGPNGLPSVGSVDERPDANLLNQPSIRDDFKMDFSASYGLTRWLALEAAVSYLEAPVGNIEYYTKNSHQGLMGNGAASSVFQCGPGLTSLCWDYQPNAPDDIKNNSFLPVGQLREIPIHLSGLFRFRPESPLDPYIGAGFGYIMTKLTTSGQFNETSETLSALTVSTASEGEFTVNNRCNREGFPYDPETGIGVGCNNFTPEPLQAKVKNAFEWHAVGGVDYYATEHFSVYVDARYVWTSGAIDIRTDRAHQVRFTVADNGRLLMLKRLYKDNDPSYLESNPDDPNHYLDPGDPTSGPYLWEDIGVPANSNFQNNICPEYTAEDPYSPGDPRVGQSKCRDSGYLETEDRNMSGALDERCNDPTNIFSDYCEDEGWLFRLPPGSRDVDESMRIPCPLCADNHLLDTEDANGNGLLDRFLVFGVDICTTPQGVGHPRCVSDGFNNLSYQFVWPEGEAEAPCVQDPRQLGPFSNLTENGCPPFPAADATGARPHVQTTGNDDAADTYIVQGGRIRMGGFSLGVGFKFTF